MKRTADDPGAVLAATVTMSAALGFVPVAVHFDLFSVLVRIGPIASAERIAEAADIGRTSEEKTKSPICLRLIQDTMLAMASLNFVDSIEDDVYGANAVTRHIDTVPSAIHGMSFFTTEPLFSAAFLMRQLVDTNFDYPFREKCAPLQYGWKLLGNEQYASADCYTILHHEGRLASFNKFMEGKFGAFGSMPERVLGFGYDLVRIVGDEAGDVVIVDVGGGQGQMLLELRNSFSHLQARNLILEEYNPDMQRSSDLTIMDWNYKSETPQPVKGARVYSFTHIFHNLPDLDALQLMKKTSEAMTSDSRLLIHEFTKNATYGKMHATMIGVFGGRERSSSEWHQMASLAGLKVTFEAYPDLGEGLVEMSKL